VLAGSHELIGRAEEFARISGAIGSGVVAIEGEAGIGKSALWDAACADAAARGWRVLATRSAQRELHLAFTGAADLLAGAHDEVTAQLPAPQRRALAAMLLLEDHERPPDVRALALAFLGALRLLAADCPLLVAIDDVQWLDRESSDVLSFAMRRQIDGRLGFLLTRRTGTAPLALTPATIVELQPLSVGATVALLQHRFHVVFPRRLLRRIHETSAGNPLFALELARSLIAAGRRLGVDEDVPLPESLNGLLAERIAAAPDEARSVLVATALEPDVRVDDVSAVVSPTAVDAALDAGLVALEAGRLRPVHPLFGPVAKAQVSRTYLRGLHRRLAACAADEEHRALHLALSVPGEDSAVAARLAAAADVARRRGAMVTAAQLAEHALRLTPVHDPARAARLVVAAERNQDAGEHRRAIDLMLPAAETLPEGQLRARAFLVLFDSEPGTVDDAYRDIDTALANAVERDGLRSEILSRRAGGSAFGRVSELARARADACEALEIARECGDSVAEKRAVIALMSVEALRGSPIDELVRRYAELGGLPARAHWSVERITGLRHAWRGELERARDLFVRAHALAEGRGEEESRFILRLQLCELALRAGEWDEAASLLAEWEQELIEPIGRGAAIWRCKALLAAGRGDPEAAEEFSQRAFEELKRRNLGWHRLETLRAVGLAALLRDEPERAAEHLTEIWEHLLREAVGEPGAFPVAPDLVEALVACGRIDEAGDVAAALTQIARAQSHPWALAASARARGLIALGKRDEETAWTEFADAAARFEELHFPFLRARALVGLGVAARRLRRRRDARAALEQAVVLFEELGSPGWAERARAELARVGGRTSANGLTPTESRVAELAARGLTNRQIAAELVVSPSAVAANLTRVYAKLGVRSRTELAGRLAGKV
jgi:DNA-binding CsgD family transcriptional regulator